jgi:hypothetical protein
MRRLTAFIVTPAVLLTAVSAAPAAVQLSANLTNAAETTVVIPTLSDGITPRPASFGTATFTLNDAQTALTMNVTVNNIDFTGLQTPDTNDNLVNAHIHASDTVTPTTTAGVVWGFIGTPFNDTNPTNVVVTPFPSGVGATIVGTWDAPEGQNTTLAAQINRILTGRSYINFHTVQFGGGEVRGNIVPEPASLALLASGAFALLARRRRA